MVKSVVNRRSRRPSDYVLGVFALLLAAWGSTWLHLALSQEESERHLERGRHWVRTLSLTDLALFTEARYTRHLSMADRHSAFQDHPMALEHFPSGSLVAPPPHLTPPERSGARP